MSEEQYVVVLAVFDTDEDGIQAYKDLREAEKDKKIDLENSVVVSKDDDGKIRIKEEAEKTGKGNGGFNISLLWRQGPACPYSETGISEEFYHML